MNQTITVLIVEPGKAPKLDCILNRPEIFEQIVGGSYDVGVFLDRETALIHCEDNKKRFATPNRFIQGMNDYIAGTFFFCGLDSTGFCSLPYTQQSYFAKLYGEDPPFFLLGSESLGGQKIVCASVGDLAKAACFLWENLKTGQAVRLSRWGGLRSGAVK